MLFEGLKKCLLDHLLGMQAPGSQKPTNNLALNVYFAYRTYLMEIEVGPMIAMGTQKIVERNH